MFNETSELPDELLSASSEDVLSILKAPTLIHLEGNESKPVFISTLLHGNETTGFYAIQKLLKEYRNKTLPRSISILIGNVEAAAENKRMLDSQADYNRIWPGTHHPDCAETDMMKTITNIMRKRKPLASVDIHNNTGFNPHYSCINILNPKCIQLASHFSKTIVHFTSPKGVQSAAFSDFCPAVVLECGQSGEVDGVDHVHDFLNTIINTKSITSTQPEDIYLYHTVARVTIPELYTFGTESNANIQLLESLENRNFEELTPGTVFAIKNSNDEARLLVSNESSEDVSEEFIKLENNEFIIKKNLTLSMYTTNEKAIKQDCLCYFMEQIRIS